MRRLVRRAEKYYHLTNDINFQPSNSYENRQQEFGKGLYITPQSNVSNWDTLLGGRKYAIPIDIGGLNIIDESQFPSMRQMAKDLMTSGFTARDIDKLVPKGDTFNRNPVELVTKREWAKLQGYDAIKPFVDSKEGEQILILDPSKVQCGKPEEIMDAIKGGYE